MANLSVTELERGSIIRIDSKTGTAMWVVRRNFLQAVLVARVDTFLGDKSTYFIDSIYLDDADLALREDKGATVWMLPGRVIELPSYL